MNAKEREAVRALLNAIVGGHLPLGSKDAVAHPAFVSVRALLNAAEDEAPNGAGCQWWCPQCFRTLNGAEVTFEECHDPRKGGCGGPVVFREAPRGELEGEIIVSGSPEWGEVCIGGDDYRPASMFQCPTRDDAERIKADLEAYAARLRK